MNENLTEITCPNCNYSIPLNKALTSQIEHTIKQQFESEQKEKEIALKKREEGIEKKSKQLEKTKQSIEQQVIEKTRLASIELKKELKIKLAKEKEDEIKLLFDELKEKDKNLSEARQNELTLRKERTKLKDEKHAFELEKQRQLGVLWKNRQNWPVYLRHH